MTVLVVGATGATGRLLVRQLIDRGHDAKVIVRSPDKLTELLPCHERLTLLRANLLDLTDAEMAQHVGGCDAVASCLGHNLTWKGLFGPPRRLVTDATRRLCEAIRATQPASPVRFVLMNTTGNRNRDLNEQVSLGERCVVGLLPLLLPPQADNEEAAEYLRARIGQEDPVIEWVAVRPDSLTHEDEVTAYDVHPSPVRSAIFNSGRTSRINVAHFMAELISDRAQWSAWRGQMPVVYNRESRG